MLSSDLITTRKLGSDFDWLIATEFDYGITTGLEYCMLLIVSTLNMNYDRKSKTTLYHADISKWYFLVCHLKMVFNFLHELKQKSSDITAGWHWRSVNSDVTEGVITTLSNRMKFRQQQPPLDVSDESWRSLLSPCTQYYLWKTIFFSFAAVHRDHWKPFVTIHGNPPPTVNIFSYFQYLCYRSDLFLGYFF